MSLRAMGESSSTKKLIELMQQQITHQRSKWRIKGSRCKLKNDVFKNVERQKSLHMTKLEALLSAQDITNTIASTSFQGTSPKFCSV